MSATTVGAGVERLPAVLQRWCAAWGVTDLASARRERDAYEQMRRRNRVKTTADWSHLDTARRVVRELEALA